MNKRDIVQIALLADYPSQLHAGTAGSAMSSRIKSGRKVMMVSSRVCGLLTTRVSMPRSGQHQA